MTHKVETVRVNTQAVSHKLPLSGSLEAIQLMRLYNEDSGRITQLPYYVGDRVKKNDLLIKLDSSMADAELSKSTALREQAKLDLERLKKLLPKKLSSEEEVARAATAYDVALAEENLQRIHYQRTLIKAPFDGIVTERHNEPGDVVAQNSHIMTLIDPDRLRLKAYVSEQWLSEFDIGSELSVSIDALGENSYQAQVSRIYPTVDPATRKGAVEIALDPAPEGARPGQLGRAVLPTRASSRRLIPSIAIHHDLDGPYIYVVNEQSSVDKRHIKTGLQYNNMTEILSGAESGEQIVTKGFLGLNSGKKVSVVNSTELATEQGKTE